MHTIAYNKQKNKDFGYINVIVPSALSSCLLFVFLCYNINFFFVRVWQCMWLLCCCLLYLADLTTNSVNTYLFIYLFIYLLTYLVRPVYYQTQRSHGMKVPSASPTPRRIRDSDLNSQTLQWNDVTGFELTGRIGNGGTCPRPPWSTLLIESECSQSQNIGWRNWWVENKNGDLLNNVWLLQRQVTLLASFPALNHEGMARLSWPG